MTPNIVTEDFIKDRVDISDNGCWMWNACRGASGYGRVCVDGFQSQAHRVVFAFYNGDIPDRHVVRHSCDTPACCNPEHLLSGTQQDNMDDMNSRGRRGKTGAKMEKHGRAKLTRKNILSIRQDSRHHGVIAKDYGVSRSLIGQVQRYEIWKQVTAAIPVVGASL